MDLPDGRRAPVPEHPQDRQFGVSRPRKSCHGRRLYTNLFVDVNEDLRGRRELVTPWGAAESSGVYSDHRRGAECERQTHRGPRGRPWSRTPYRRASRRDHRAARGCRLLRRSDAGNPRADPRLRYLALLGTQRVAAGRVAPHPDSDVVAVPACRVPRPPARRLRLPTRRSGRHDDLSVRRQRHSGGRGRAGCAAIRGKPAPAGPPGKHGVLHRPGCPVRPRRGVGSGRRALRPHRVGGQLLGRAAAAIPDQRPTEPDDTSPDLDDGVLPARRPALGIMAPVRGVCRSHRGPAGRARSPSSASRPPGRGSPPRSCTRRCRFFCGRPSASGSAGCACPC